MKFTKEDVYVHEVYSPPQGEKEVFLFPRAFGGTDYWSFFRVFKLKADRRITNSRNFWECRYSYSLKLFVTKDRFTVFDVVNFLNKPSKERTELFRVLIEESFK